MEFVLFLNVIDSLSILILRVLRCPLLPFFFELFFIGYDCLLDSLVEILTHFFLPFILLNLSIFILVKHLQYTHQFLIMLGLIDHLFRHLAIRVCSFQNLLNWQFTASIEVELIKCFQRVGKSLLTFCFNLGFLSFVKRFHYLYFI